MKKHAIPALILALVAVLAFASCDMINNFIASRTRNIAVIQVFNSNHEETKYFQPTDTLYVQVQGLKANGFYEVDCLDPDGAVISMLTAIADENGVISPSPLWYDVGFKKVLVSGVWKSVLPTATELGLNAFNIRVHDAEATNNVTDFKLPFFVVFNSDIARPKPLVMVGKKDSGTFYPDHSFTAGVDDIYVQVANLTSLPTPAPASGKVKICIVPFDAGSFTSGDTIPRTVVEQEATVADLTNGVKITAASSLWFDSGSNAWSPIPSAAKGKAFSVFIDVNEDGIYEEKKDGTANYYLDGIAGNGVAAFIVKSDPIPLAAVKYIPANIASGGVTWGHHWWDTWPDYDYRNTFNADGSGTQYGYDWNFGGYGVKAIWNPYIDNPWPHAADPNSTSTLYYGRYVDLYIVLTSSLDLTGANSLVAAPGTHKLTLPVQSACTNGANQQTIWRAPMVAGDYCIVLDLDGNGKVSDGDIVDNLAKDGTVRALGGFSVQ
jgi:hypothetical protein